MMTRHDFSGNPVAMCGRLHGWADDFAIDTDKCEIIIDDDGRVVLTIGDTPEILVITAVAEMEGDEFSDWILTGMLVVSGQEPQELGEGPADEQTMAQIITAGALLMLDLIDDLDIDDDDDDDDDSGADDDDEGGDEEPVSPKPRQPGGKRAKTVPSKRVDKGSKKKEPEPVGVA